MVESFHLHHGDRLDFLHEIGSGSAQLVLTSPPYNMGKEYEDHLPFDEYMQRQHQTLQECRRIMGNTGSLCWQVGNFVKNGEIVPLDIPIYNICKQLDLKLRNRIVWTFEHGLHCTHRFSHRYETVLWFTGDKYKFNLDPVRIPQKYPGKKYFKGPKRGQLSCNPLGKNPGDVWAIPSVKFNHVEKTDHPCQFPMELAERLVLSLTDPGDLVVDPYIGSGTTGCAALLHGRRACGSDTSERYIEIARHRMGNTLSGELRTRAWRT